MSPRPRPLWCAIGSKTPPPMSEPPVGPPRPSGSIEAPPIVTPADVPVARDILTPAALVPVNERQELTIRWYADPGPKQIGLRLGSAGAQAGSTLWTAASAATGEDWAPAPDHSQDEAAHPTWWADNVPWYAVETSHDLISGRHLPIGLDNELKGYQYEWNYKTSEREYTPAALRRAGVR